MLGPLPWICLESHKGRVTRTETRCFQCPCLVCNQTERERERDSVQVAKNKVVPHGDTETATRTIHCMLCYAMFHFPFALLQHEDLPSALSSASLRNSLGHRRLVSLEDKPGGQAVPGLSWHAVVRPFGVVSAAHVRATMIAGTMRCSQNTETDDPHRIANGRKLS